MRKKYNLNITATVGTGGPSPTKATKDNKTSHSPDKGKVRKAVPARGARARKPAKDQVKNENGKEGEDDEEDEEKGEEMEEEMDSDEFVDASVVKSIEDEA